MIPDLNGNGWKSRGGRVWIYPEALLSGKHLCKEGSRKVREIKLAGIDNISYDEGEGEQKLEFTLVTLDTITKLCITLVPSLH